MISDLLFSYINTIDECNFNYCVYHNDKEDLHITVDVLDKEDKYLAIVMDNNKVII